MGRAGRLGLWLSAGLVWLAMAGRAEGGLADPKAYLSTAGPAPLRYQAMVTASACDAASMSALRKALNPVSTNIVNTNDGGMTTAAEGKAAGVVMPEDKAHAKEGVTNTVSSAPQQMKYVIKPLQVSIFEGDSPLPGPQPDGKGQVVSPQMLLKFFGKGSTVETNSKISVITPLDLQPVTSPPTRDSRATYSEGP